MKTRRTKKWRRMAASSAAAFLALAIASPAALGAALEVTAETIDVVEVSDIADAQFSLTVTNGESELASDVYVVFEDGLEVSVGDVAPGGSATSAPLARSIDLLEMPTRNSPMPVTLTYTLDGEYAESPATLVVHLGVPLGD